MPLVQRAIEPYFTSRHQLDKTVKNELEGVVANTLGELIRQLSSLSKHAENLFGELFREADGMYHRSNQLNQRVEVLVGMVTRLDPVVEEGRPTAHVRTCTVHTGSYTHCTYVRTWLQVWRELRSVASLVGVLQQQ